MTQTPVRSHSRPSAAVSQLDVACTRSPGRFGAIWFHLIGELDLGGASTLEEELRDAQSSTYMVVLDLRDLDFIDCAGLGVLVSADARARLAKRSLVLVCSGGQVGRMLEQTGLLGKLEVVDLEVPATLGESRA